MNDLMHDAPFVLVDRVRVEQFTLLGRTRRLFRTFDLHCDRDGIAWAVQHVGNHAFAFTWLGSGWVFDLFASRIWAAQRTERLLTMKHASAETHRQQLTLTRRKIHLGSHCERLLWFIHQQILQARRSVLHPADSALATAVWGRNRRRWPRQWRQDLAGLLQGLAWLHIAEGRNGDLPTWGRNTALLTHVADLRGEAEDKCAGLCPKDVSPRHHHYLINVGRGFLGLLEQFGQENEDSGSRSYQFQIRGPRDAGPTLSRVGRTGRLVSLYLPARLGEPAACRQVSAPQHRLLQALVRETTRPPRLRGPRSSVREQNTGNIIPSASGRRKLPCPLLSADSEYVGFNGNGKRAGLGYYLTTSGGWLKKAGYTPAETPTFLADLAALQSKLGLAILGIEKSPDRFYGLDELQALAAAPALHATLRRVFVRVYTCADYVQRWNHFFGGSGDKLAPRRAQAEDVLALVTEMQRHQISRRDLAQGIGADPSFFSKVLNGKKSWPIELLAKSRAWLTNRNREAKRPPAIAWPSLPTWAEDSASLLDVALAYRERGWSVVPQQPGDKKPTVRWKTYQHALPSIPDLQSWFRTWPSAGLAVVLGPVSDLFVVDVDGPEAHAALLRHLGEEPVAPKALSGSRKPLRYHLYFRCPDCLTKAKATPWHPHLEFRGQGGIVVIPPSLHPSGQRYAWEPGRSPADLSLPDVPGPILAALQPQARQSAPAAVPLPTDLSVSPSTRRFLAGSDAEGPLWNDRLFQAACDLAGRKVSQETAEPLLLAGARPWNETERENAIRTIRSAFSQARFPSRT